jgi:hypothetical protein
MSVGGISGVGLSGTAAEVLKPFEREGPLGLLAVHSKSSHCAAERKTGGYAALGNCRTSLLSNQAIQLAPDRRYNIDGFVDS